MDRVLVFVEVHAADGASLAVGDRHGPVIERNVGAWIRDGLSQIPQCALRADVGQVRTEKSTRAADRMTHDAAAALVHAGTRIRIAGAAFGRSLPRELLHVSDDTPDLDVGNAERAWHLGIRDAVSDRRKQLAVGAAVTEGAGVQHGAPSTLAVLSVTMTAASLIQLLPKRQILG